MLIPNGRHQKAIALARRLRKRGKSLMAIRARIPKSGVPISYETVCVVLARPEGESA